MTAREQLLSYLQSVEARLRAAAAARGAAVTAAAALAATVVAVLGANAFTFSAPSVTAARFAVFLAVALAFALGLAIPLVRLSNRSAARAAERRFPDFQERLLTFAEKGGAGRSNPFLELLAADTLGATHRAEPAHVVRSGLIAACTAAGAGALAALVWLIASGPGFLGHGASLVWAGTPRDEQPYYRILIEPGDRRVRRSASQVITARLIGFQAERVRLLARYRGTSKWEEAPMLPQEDAGVYRYLFAAVPETLDYYVHAGSLRSMTHTLTVVDLPVVRRLRVTYRFPGWTGLAEAVEDPGGDLRAAAGTEAEIAVETDRPLHRGALVLEGGAGAPLEERAGNWSAGRLKIDKDGSYFIAVHEQGEIVRLTDDYFIEAGSDAPPSVRILRPGRDTRASPIEEVTVAVEAGDDFGLREMNLHYSVNGGPEQTVALLARAGPKQAAARTVIGLEDFRLVPGDVVALYASARDAHTLSRTDVFFIEAQPFEREYSQSQIAGGAAAGDDQGRISQRQKEIIAATWNQLRQTPSGSGAADAARFLAGVQTRLAEQARSLAARMRRRLLTGANEELRSFADDMERAAEAMRPASERLRAIEWREALPHEQKALQYLLRAEAVFRQIRMAFGASQGGPGSLGRDLESLFDLEMDTEKNQYESGQQELSGDRGSKELEEALRKLEELARQQQELAERRRSPQQPFDQRWQQETLRRQAENLRRQLEQLARGDTRPERGQEAGQPGERGQEAQRLEQALRRLREATEEMGRANSRQAAGQPGGEESERAARRLREAQDLVSGLSEQQASRQLDDLVRQADSLASRQREFIKNLEQIYGPNPEPRGMPRGAGRPETQELASEKERMTRALSRLEDGMKSAARDLAQSRPSAASKVREGLDSLQQNDVSLRMRGSHELLRRGLGHYAWSREGPVTRALEDVRESLRQARADIEREPARTPGAERALAQLERIRERLEEASRPGGGGGEVSSTMNRSEVAPPVGGAEPRPANASDIQRLYRDTMRDLSEARESLAEDRDAPRSLLSLMREMERLDPARFPGNPRLLERMNAQLLPALDRLELLLKRKLDEQQGQARTGTPEPVPPGYAEAVAEYFRRLSRSR